MDRFDVAMEAAEQAAAALRQSHLRQDDVSQKTGPQDLVTAWDRKTERLLREAILSRFPRDAIVGEEFPPSEAAEAAVTWYLDPIDGTTNFVQQHRNYAISIGCWAGTSPLFGLVLDVEQQTLYWARHGEGAWRDRTPIRVSSRRALSELLLLAPDIPHSFLRPHPRQACLVELARKVRGVRSLGSVALELCQVAAGEADLFVATRSSPWDHNAARIILQEAGGAIFDLDGAPLPLDRKSTVLALNSGALKELVLGGPGQPPP